MAWYRCVGGAGGSLKLRTASGRIATFNTNMVEAFKSLQSNITPVQDLHGYSKPWSGGGGKNKLYLTMTTPITDRGFIATKNDDQSVKITASGGSPYTALFTISNFLLKAGTYTLTGCPSGGSYSNYVLRLENMSSVRVAADLGSGDTFTLSEDTQLFCRIYCYSESALNKVFYPMVRLSSVSDASFEPYENICPISGFSALNVTRTGKNFAKSDNTDNPQKTYYSYTTETPDKVVGVKNHASNMFFYVFEAYVVSGNTYHFHYGKYQINGANSNCSIYLYSDNVLGTSLGNFLVPDTGYTWTSNYAGRILIGIYGIGGNGSTFEIDEFMLSDTATDYSPYNGQTATVNFGQTVYGGVADVTNGVLKITHEYCVFNGTETITSNTQGGHTRFSCQKLVNLADNNASNENFCSHFIASSSPIGQNQIDNAIGVYNRGLYWRADQFTDITAMKNYLLAQYNANTPVMYVAKLATPIEITTTPENLTAISGENNVYSDTNGDMEVKYLYRE